MVWGVALVWLLSPVLFGPGAQEGQKPPGGLSRFEFQETHMASTFKIVLYSTDEATARRASRAAYERIAALNAVLSDYDPESELSRLSRSAGGPASRVSADLFEVLDASKRIFERSDGAFDVTIAPVGRLWRRARRDHKLPDPLKLAEARLLVGSDKLVLDKAARTVRLAKPGMKLDVGGIAKGYAAQAALNVLMKSGVTRALSPERATSLSATRRRMPWAGRSPSRPWFPARRAPHPGVCCLRAARSRPPATPSSS